MEKLIAANKYKQYEIAEMVGYKDFGYYIKVFKKRYGITPVSYTHLDVYKRQPASLEAVSEEAED